jgi:hypothetical protein
MKKNKAKRERNWQHRVHKMKKNKAKRVFLHLVYPMLPVSLDYPFVIAPAVLSDVYFHAMKQLT